jgi:hypothetical protein
MRYLLVLLLFLASFAAAQTITFTTAPHAYPVAETLPWTSQDSNPIPAGDYGEITLGYSPLPPAIQIAVDPVNGGQSTYLPGLTIVSSAVIASESDSHGYIDYTVQYDLVNTMHPDNGYVWSGTFTVRYVRQNLVSCGGRAHRICSIYAVNAGNGELTATLQ